MLAQLVIARVSDTVDERDITKSCAYRNADLSKTVERKKLVISPATLNAGMRIAPHVLFLICGPHYLSVRNVGRRGAENSSGRSTFKHPH
jgi:hypothetical protein